MTLPKRKQGFTFWWPRVVRIMGLVGGFTEAGYALVTHQSADVAFMTFCGSLVIAPLAFGQTDHRDDRGTEGES